MGEREGGEGGGQTFLFPTLLIPCSCPSLGSSCPCTFVSYKIFKILHFLISPAPMAPRKTGILPTKAHKLYVEFTLEANFI